LGTKLIPKLRAGDDLRVSVTFSVTFDAEVAKGVEAEIRQVLQDLGLEDTISID
jgi:ferredoxin-fold anticodon binding domain-containing protein